MPPRTSKHGPLDPVMYLNLQSPQNNGPCAPYRGLKAFVLGTLEVRMVVGAALRVVAGCSLFVAGLGSPSLMHVNNYSYHVEVV